MNSHHLIRNRFRNAGATGILALASFVVGSIALPTPAAFAQATPTSGAIQGSVTDPSGAAVPNAQITFTNTGTGIVRTVKTDSAGFYNSGALNAGQYAVKITAPGFQTLQSSVAANVNVVSGGNFKLSVGQSSQTVTVEAGTVQVNTEQSSVQNTLTSQQINTLPVNGRNFLDLAQLEPGVILQSGETFDPTKAGYSALSFAGVAGRTTRIQLDGQDITDETVGTTIFNVSQGAVDQVQVSRSTQDVSGDITSTGAVQAATISGTNAFHGNAFYNFQDHSVGFGTERGVDTPFQRNQFGGAIGGPIIKDKLFFFANSERIKQDTGTVSTVGSLFLQHPSTISFRSIPLPRYLFHRAPGLQRMARHSLLCPRQL